MFKFLFLNDVFMRCTGFTCSW